MAIRRRRGRQRELFGNSQRPAMLIDPTHRLVMLADTLDWDAIRACTSGPPQKENP
jgi:hypothetical protein